MICAHCGQPAAEDRAGLGVYVCACCGFAARMCHGPKADLPRPEFPAGARREWSQG